MCFSLPETVRLEVENLREVMFLALSPPSDITDGANFNRTNERLVPHPYDLSEQSTRRALSLGHLFCTGSMSVQKTASCSPTLGMGWRLKTLEILRAVSMVSEASFNIFLNL